MAKKKELEEITVEVEEELSEEDMLAMFGAKPEDAPVAPTTHGLEDAYEISG